MQRMIVTTEGCEGLDPPDVLGYLPPGGGAGLCRLPRGTREEAVAERTTQLVSQDFVQIRSITTLL